jgi:hypothetical protein
VSDRAFAIAACALIWAQVTWETNFERPDPAMLFFAFGALALAIALLAARRLSPWIAVALAGAGGLYCGLRQGSVVDTDVARSMAEALQCVAQWCNPYAHFFASTNPPGSPFPYLPGGMLYYALQNGWWNGLSQMDRPAFLIVTLSLIALAFARNCGPGRAALALAFYSFSTFVLFRAMDGSNDTALAALLALGTVALAFGNGARAKNGRAKFALYVASALFFGWAVGFKALAWPIWLFVWPVVPAAYRRVWLLCSIGFAVLLTLPFFARNPVAFVHSISAGFTFHTNAWGLSLWSALDRLYPGLTAHLGMLPFAFEIFAVLGSVIALWGVARRHLGEALGIGGAVLAVALAMTRWSTSPYYAFVLAIVALALVTYRSEDADDEGFTALSTKA